MFPRSRGRILFLSGIAAFAVLLFLTVAGIRTPSLVLAGGGPQLLDRNGVPLTATFQTRWNRHDLRSLHEVPALLQKAFVISEDKRFFSHHGIDWRARATALWQNVRHGNAVRGASTITEQVVRMVHPRPRNMWSKWLETFEAYLLERGHSKADILEFYFNQVPYASNRRGLAQAARYYFDRDLSTLTAKEMLALVVLARAPSGYDLYKSPGKTEVPLRRLAARLGMGERALRQELRLARPDLPASAAHFSGHALAVLSPGVSVLRTTIDSGLQKDVKKILDDRVQALEKRNLHNAAALVADHRSGEILAWVVAGGEATPARDVDAVTVPRQPGSALKPFLYALALERGWTAATMLNDAPLSEGIGTGLHRFRNYSNVFYGRITLREALANSLNIPALLAAQFVGPGDYLAILRKLGFASLDQSADIYDEGLALGVGEVTLLELVQGYAALANKGVFRRLSFMSDDPHLRRDLRIYSPEAASLVADILSDPWARRLEFGNSSVLNLPVQTAVKTGTSTDYRDAWAVGFNDRYVVGIWMGNLDYTPTDGITGGSGPALALRSVFTVLNRNRDTASLWLSPRLARRDVCIEGSSDKDRCYMRSEYFIADMPATGKTTRARFELVKPTDGLQMALDPRIPEDLQKFEFTLRGLKGDQSAEWVLNGTSIGISGGTFLWPLERGKFRLEARVLEEGRVVQALSPVSYIVK